MFSVIQNVNGVNSIVAEGLDYNGAKVNFHRICQNLWNALDVRTATVKIMDDSLNTLEGDTETIVHVQEEPEEVTE
jgi:hypothetical protein